MRLSSSALNKFKEKLPLLARLFIMIIIKKQKIIIFILQLRMRITSRNCKIICRQMEDHDRISPCHKENSRFNLFLGPPSGQNSRRTFGGSLPTSLALVQVLLAACQFLLGHLEFYYGPVSAWLSGSAHKLLMTWFDAGLSESVSVEL